LVQCKEDEGDQHLGSGTAEAKMGSTTADLAASANKEEACMFALQLALASFLMLKNTIEFSLM
jgi:hypothetical protein